MFGFDPETGGFHAVLVNDNNEILASLKGDYENLLETQAQLSALAKLMEE